MLIYNVPYTWPDSLGNCRSSLFHSTIVYGKKENLEISVLLWYVAMSSELRVLYEWLTLVGSSAS